MRSVCVAQIRIWKFYLFVFILHYNFILIIFFKSDIPNIRKEYDKLSGKTTAHSQMN